MNQINYDRQMQAQIESLPSGSRPTLLLHSCCGPCSSAVLERLAPHFDITVFFYNPNILPAEEYLSSSRAIRSGFRVATPSLAPAACSRPNSPSSPG